MIGLVLAAGIALDAGEAASLVREEMARRCVPGLAAAVVRNGEVVWTGAFGLADLENDIPVTTQTVFRFASVSKPITAVAAMRLVEGGRLALDEPVARIVSGLPASMAKVTPRHLLAHQSGLRHYPSDGRGPLTHYTRLSDAVLERAGDGLLFEPGTRSGYSTHGYSVLGWAMEAAAGRTFDEVVHAEVFVPAAMATARSEDVYALIPRRARGYFLSLAGQVRNARAIDPSDKKPGGGLCGSILDLAAWVAALQKDRLLSAAAREAMWTPARRADGSPTEYGLGWHVYDEGGRRAVYHSGSQPGTSAFVYLEPQTATGAVVLGNLEQVDFLSLARKLACAR